MMMKNDANGRYLFPLADVTDETRKSQKSKKTQQLDQSKHLQRTTCKQHCIVTIIIIFLSTVT